MTDYTTLADEQLDLTLQTYTITDEQREAVAEAFVTINYWINVLIENEDTRKQLKFFLSIIQTVLTRGIKLNGGN